VYRLKLFGRASIEGPEGPVIGRAAQRRRLALLALLATARDQGLTRDKLIGLVWPESAPDRARHLLSDSIYRVNRALGGDALVAAGDGLRIDPQRLSADVWELRSAVDEQDWRRVVELHAAPFLDGFFLTGADELERWVDRERELLARYRARALEELAGAAEAGDATGEAVRWWRLLTEQDPYSSRAALRLVRALDRNGERAEALHHAHLHEARLREELGLEPDADLRAFVDGLRSDAVPAAGRPAASEPELPQGSPQGAVPDPSAGASGPRPIAVLPFVNLGGDPESEAFADGITEDVIAQLSKIGALAVTARASVMRFKDHRESTRDIGAALGVATLLGGSVRRSGDRVRIVTQLVDSDTGRCLWAETYDRGLSDVFAIQTDVALQIAAALNARLSGDERTRLRREPTRDVGAYQLYLQGRHWTLRYTEDGLRQGIRYYERALARDPNFALAHVGVAMAYEELGETGVLAGEDAYRRANDAALAAYAIDPELAEAHCILGQLAVAYAFDWENAEREFRRALELSPSHAATYDLFGRMCSAIGRHDEAVAMQRRAQALDPLDHRADLATALLRAGRYEEALEEATRAVEFDPSYARGWATLGWAHILNDQYDEGLAELERAAAMTPDATQWFAQLGQAYGMAGRVDRAREVLGRLQERAREGFVSPYHLAYVYTGLGEHGAAMDCLERACRDRGGAVYGMAGSFLFEALHGNPRFHTLARRMNLPASFRRTLG